MMQKIKSFILTSILGGLTVILPATIILMVFGWILDKVTVLISPITSFIVENSHTREFFANIVVIFFLVLVCFLIGLMERTKLGKFLFNILENNLLSKIPGYSIIKDTIVQFIGGKNTPFSQVALVRIFGTETKCTAFITDEHDDGSYSVFVPTGPNPTSGQIFHLKSEFVEKVDASVELTMKSIISCGAGSKHIIKRST